MNTVNTLLNGATANELSDRLHDVVEGCRLTGKQGTLTLKLTVKPQGMGTGQYEIRDAITSKVPELDKGMTLMFGTPEGNLQRNDPNQRELPLREVQGDKPQLNQKEA
jgi:hypothetical protein